MVFSHFPDSSESLVLNVSSTCDLWHDSYGPKSELLCGLPNHELQKKLSLTNKQTTVRTTTFPHAIPPATFHQQRSTPDNNPYKKMYHHQPFKKNKKQKKNPTLTHSTEYLNHRRRRFFEKGKKQQRQNSPLSQGVTIAPSPPPSRIHTHALYGTQPATIKTRAAQAGRQAGFREQRAVTETLDYELGRAG